MALISSTRSRIFVGLLLLLLVGAFAMPLFAQSGSVDLTFNAVPSNPLPTDINFQQVIQPDGKIIVYNAPTMFVGGELRSGMFRLNADGSFDPTFSYNNEGGVGINNVMIAPDGKIVLAGSSSPNHAKMVRLNSDGSLDNTFSVLITAVGPPEFTGNVFTVNAIQPDGKVIATHTSWGNIAGTWYSYSMRRYNLDSSVDTGFVSPPLEGGHLMVTRPLIELLPDGRFYLALTSRSHLGGFLNITRRTANGTVDSTYTAFQASISASSFLSIEDISITLEGGLLATGALVQTAIGFPPREQLRRFLPDGSSAPGFITPAVMSASRVHQLPDGKILYSASGGTVSRPLIRLEANGSVDATYALDPAVTGIVNTWQPDALGRPIFLAQTAAGRRFVRLLDNGSIDPSFNPVLGAPGSTNLVAVQPDGKVLVAGTFTQMNGVDRKNFARVNADGSTDTTFNPGSSFNIAPRQLAVQPDGKILAVGAFGTYNGATVGPVVRINADGSLDTGFAPTVSVSSIEAVALQLDGKILIGGTFGNVNGVGRTGIARLESNGTLDTAFNPVIGSAGIKTILVESNGKIVIGGLFTGVNGVDRNNLARLESDGSTDSSFNAVGVAITSGLWKQQDGKYLITTGSAFTLLRRNTDGSSDAGFTSPTLMFGSNAGSVSSVVPQPDGSMVIGGRFNSVNGTTRWHLTRLAPNGSHDPTFLTTGANLEVFGAARYSDGKIMVAGLFTWIDNVTAPGIARMNVPAFQRKTRFDFDGDGRAEVAVYRPSSGIWYQLFSSGAPYGSPTFGQTGDVPTPADFDGDGKTDLAIYRPSTGVWWYRISSTGQLLAANLGHRVEDKPMPSDVNGDGTDDFVIYRPSENKWYWTTTTGQNGLLAFGAPGDIPVIGDFDGDGKSDRAVFRPSTGDWWYAASGSAGAHRQFHCGVNGDIPAPADYDGDGKTDFGVYRPSDGGWYIFRSSDFGWITQGFGLAGDRPVPADYDGDGRADIAVFRPSTGIWYLLQSTAGTGGLNWGLATDIAIPNAFTAP